MAGFADLVRKSQPAYYAGGVSAGGTEGRTWSHEWIDVLDDAGATINLTAVTGTCVVTDGTKPGGAVVATLTFTGGVGTFTVGLTKAATAALANGDGSPRQCVWSLKLDDGTSAVQVWGSDNSRFVIKSGS